jgi:hypothetical protein
MRATMRDGRQLVGQILAFDKHMNQLLAAGGVVEYTIHLFSRQYLLAALVNKWLVDQVLLDAGRCRRVSSLSLLSTPITRLGLQRLYQEKSFPGLGIQAGQKTTPPHVIVSVKKASARLRRTQRTSP